MGSHQHAKMGEGSKQVRVDNWGIFFLQRLQMFFNKTDFCDLTLQFEGNVQLKVHRLVMNACTEYFRALEEACEIDNDVLVMPADLQADVVLPIVNFMYTGMLEFHMSMYDKLYKTANLMNITVLTKLLDAQKVPIPPMAKPTHKKNMQVPHTWNLQGKKISAKTMDPDLPAPLPGRKIPVWKRKSAPSVPHSGIESFFTESKKQTLTDPLAYFDNAPKPTRFEWPDDDISSLNTFDGAFNDISYTSTPLMIKSEEPKPSTSFDGDSNRLSSCYDDESLDTDYAKDYLSHKRIRSDEEYYDEESSTQNSVKRKSTSEQPSSKKVRFNMNEKENQKIPKISIKPTGKLTSDVDHTRIISEVLKKLPNLVKKNRNIKLKILSKLDNVPPTPVALEQVEKPKKANITRGATPDEKPEEGPWRCEMCSTPEEPLEFVLYYLYRKHMTDMHHEKFDARMCKYCGHKTSKTNLLLYHQYTRHGIRPPAGSYQFPKCSLCPYIALSESLLVKHKMNHGKHELQCIECKVAFMNQQALYSHSLITGHNGKLGRNSYDCQYCTKRFHSGSTLFTHIKMQHRDEARRDGIVSIDEVEDTDDDDDDQSEYIVPEIRSAKNEKVKILSDVKLSSMEMDQANEQPLGVQRSSEADSLNNVASGIATSLGLVDVVVLNENEQYILHTNNQQSISSGESEFILPDLQDSRFTTTQQVITSEPNVITQSMLHNTDITSTDELVMVLTDHDYGDSNNEIISNENSNIVVLYSHPIEGQDNQFITSQGNIMLTSQAGIIDLRNTNTVVSSTTPFVNNVHSPQIESIEMIQREIDQHPTIQEQQILSQDMVILASKPTEVVDNTALERELSSDIGNLNANQEVVINDVPQTTDMVVPENEEHVDQNAPIIETEDKSVETNENNEPITCNSQSEALVQTTDAHSHECNDLAEPPSEEAIDDDKDLPENENNTMEQENVEEQHEENFQMPNEEQLQQPNENQLQIPDDEEQLQVPNEEQTKLPNEEDSTNTEMAMEIEEIENDKVTEEVEQENISIEPSDNTICNNSTTNQTEESLLTENNTQSVNDSMYNTQVEHSQVEELAEQEDNPTQDENEADTPKEGVENTSEIPQDTSEVSQSSEAESPDANVHERLPLNNTDDDNTASLVPTNETNTIPVIATPDKSAKIILEDWEDTDSQQSDTKSANVNKLIDDWDDDEDERRN